MDDTYTMHTLEIFDAQGNLKQKVILSSLAEIEAWAGKNKSVRISKEVLSVGE